MALPLVEQYIDVIRKKDSSTLFSLIDFDFEQDAKGFVYFEGTSAVAFKARKEGRNFAVRFFLRGGPDTFHRYEQLAHTLSANRYSWVVPFEFLSNEVLIGGQFYPVVKMDWADGTPLHTYIEQHLQNRNALTLLQHKLAALANNMEGAGIAHGDLKYNNIIIQQAGNEYELKLIDYDTMYIPVFEGKPSLEIGSPGFQPLKRLTSHFSPVIDRFSIWVILTTLEAAKADPQNWAGMQRGGFNNEHSLFSAADFLQPGSSPTFQKLRSYSNETLNAYLEKLVGFSKLLDFSHIEKPFVLGEEKPRPVAQPVSATEPTITIEIKSVPAGKDVFVREQKRGITPLPLSLKRSEWPFVSIINEGTRTPVGIEEGKVLYEFDFSKKTPAPVEDDEIIEFAADKYQVQEGDFATLKWKVKGSGRIHISNMGEVEERWGSKQIVLKNTTHYVLTIGDEARSLTIRVQPKRIEVPLQTKPAKETETTTASKNSTVFTKAKSTPANRKFALVALLAIALSIVGYFVYSKATQQKQVVSSAAEVPAQQAAFPKADVLRFLNSLYAAYNSHRLTDITAHYAPLVREYYDTKMIAADSLALLMKDLFIAPAFYQCTPDYTTLSIEQQGDQCKLLISVKEKIQTEKNGKRESYASTLEYVIDPGYKIISEKNVTAN